MCCCNSMRWAIGRGNEFRETRAGKGFNLQDVENLAVFPSPTTIDFPFFASSAFTAVSFLVRAGEAREWKLRFSPCLVSCVASSLPNPADADASPAFMFPLGRLGSPERNKPPDV